jgi:plastocyanin
MLKKEVNIAIIAILVIALAIIGVSVYNILTKEQVVIQEDISEPGVVVPEPKPAAVEKPVEIEELPKTITILISRNSFDKPEIVIQPGTKVIWENTDTRQHVILDKRDQLQFRNIKKILNYGDTFEYTFNDAGVYEIIEANFGIKGKVIVQNSDIKSNLITGNVVSNLEVDGFNFFLTSLNLLVITLAALVLGFYVSRRRHIK